MSCRSSGRRFAAEMQPETTANPPRNPGQQFRTAPPHTVWTVDPQTDVGDAAGAPFPTKLHLSLCSDCNLACRHCARSHWNCGGAMMPRPMIDAVIADFFPSIKALQLGGGDNGEQMLSPHFSHVLEQAIAHGIDVDLITNATAITPRSAETIVASTALVQISLEGVGGGYEEVRGFPWKRLLRNLELLVEARRRAGSPRPAVELLVTVMRQYEKDVFEILELARRLSLDRVRLRDFIPYDYAETRQSLLYFPRRHARFYRRIRERAEHLGVPIGLPPAIPLRSRRGDAGRRSPCGQPFEVFGIQTDGKIIPCCVGPVDLGRYTPGHDNVVASWKSESFVQLRRTVNSDDPPAACRSCGVVNLDPLVTRPVFSRPTGRWRGRIGLALALLRQRRYRELARGVAKVLVSATSGSRSRP